MKHLLLVDDDINLSKVLSYQLEKRDFKVEVAHLGSDSVKMLENTKYDVILTDLQLPDISGMQLISKFKTIDPTAIIIMITAHGSVDLAIEACYKGADDYLTKPFSQEQMIFSIEKAIKSRNLKREYEQLKDQVSEKNKFSGIIAASANMQEIISQSSRAAPTDETILLLGESGTGKELFARAIHFNSKRSDKPFVVVNCPSIPANLIESELFGHVKGSFTGAIVNKTGKFEIADGGTLFLDEIGDLPEDLQAKLLRVLQERTFEAVGSNHSKQVNVRIIAATNKNLQQEVNQGKFRPDLYYRLNVIPITIPPLRQRLEDIPFLMNEFIHKLEPRKNIYIEPEVIDELMKYPWPGNVRELENLVKRMLIFQRNDTLTLMDIPSSFLHSVSIKEAANTFDDMQKEVIINALRNAGGNKSKAARILNLPRHVLLYKIKKLNLEV